MVSDLHSIQAGKVGGTSTAEGQPSWYLVALGDADDRRRWRAERPLTERKVLRRRDAIGLAIATIPCQPSRRDVGALRVSFEYCVVLWASSCKCTGRAAASEASSRRICTICMLSGSKALA